MKVLFCYADGHADIVCPDPTPLQPVACRCGRHKVWWVEPTLGTLRVSDVERDRHWIVTETPGGTRWAHSGIFWRPAAYVLGINNGFLFYPESHTRDSVQALLDAIPNTYLFQRQGSHIIRIRPGDSNDTAWAPTPRDGQMGTAEVR
jgi:hypothetical protein